MSEREPAKGAALTAAWVTVTPHAWHSQTSLLVPNARQTVRTCDMTRQHDGHRFEL